MSDRQPTSVTPPRPPVIDVRELMNGRQEIIIRHDREHYRLRITRNGKLILTK